MCRQTIVLSLLLFAYQAAPNEANEFKVSGRIIFPKDGVYTHIPENSCLVVKVFQNIQCITTPCNTPQSGKLVTRNVQILNNTFEYEVTCKHLDAPLYAISSQLHIGWCPTEDYTGGYIKEGDYDIKWAYDFTIKGNETNKNVPDIELEPYIKNLCGAERCSVKKESCQMNSNGTPYCHCLDQNGCGTLQPEKEYFKLSGKILFPTNGVYTHIPKHSCLVVKVYKNILCFTTPCNIPQSGKSVTHNVQILNNTFEYEVTCKHLNASSYAISTQFHIGWCPTANYTGGYIKRGDYHNAWGYHFIMRKNETNKNGQDMKMEPYIKSLCGTERCMLRNESCRINDNGKAYCHCNDQIGCGRTTVPTTTTTTTKSTSIKTTQTSSVPISLTIPTAPTNETITRSTVTTTTKTTTDKITINSTPGQAHGIVLAGAAVLPSKGIYPPALPTESCLHIKVWDKPNCMDDCGRKMVVHTTIKNLSIKNGTILYIDRIDHLNVGEEYSVSAILNVGWCYKEKDGVQIKSDDYVSDTSNIFRIRSGVKYYYVDINMKNNGKYHCGATMCYATEKCMNNDFFSKSYCQCPYDYACANPSEWICANDGKSYSSECKMRRADCSSRTLQKVRDGKCEDAVTSNASNGEKEKDMVMISSISGSVFLLLIVLLIAMLVCLSRRKINAMSGNVQENNGNGLAGSIKKKKILEDFAANEHEKEQRVTENVYVDISPTRVKAPPSYKEYEFDKPPVYEDIRCFENNAYKI
ncbi:uncharacterized protein LOC130625654 [Hydractinia symbiolongicarpus]|uniref:uncharacterized protein LOC130625654 n=1 Tax=Hydractinia symbiolongicarpus TaxID=13093 RepID=UPI00254FF0DF|nr:uncharacterized protein LOC130625654 [Hydractinia symbiolongicarpus]